MPEVAILDTVVSSPAFSLIPKLRPAIEKWITLAANEGIRLCVSCVASSKDWISVRLTYPDWENGGDEIDGDWIEWLIPITFSKANEYALDHFVCRNMHEALRVLKVRRGTTKVGESCLLEFVGREGIVFPDEPALSGGEIVAKKLPAMEPEKPKRGRPARDVTITPETTRSKTKAAVRETRSMPSTPPPKAKMPKGKTKA